MSAAIDALALQFSLAAAIGAVALLWHGAFAALSFLLVLIDPAGTTGVLAILILAFPDIIGGARLRWPVPITLPLLYVALLFTGKAVFDGPLNPVLRVGDAQRWDRIWLDPAALAVLAVIQVIALSAICRSRRRAPAG
jgi:cell division protein FtsW (lipid II flippase)